MSRHMELMRKVETLNLLQDSNKMLREENGKLQAQLQETSAKVTFPTPSVNNSLPTH
jgi:nucleoprotein TPR